MSKILTCVWDYLAVDKQ